MPNRLANATSPYLQQHADNPVDWMEWGEEAFERARREDKPIFLSIGYSTCHWCHVMAHESFENEAIARLLNAHFVPVKVDREERPDVDRVYMTYVQALTGHGGWPLSAWLTPDLKPFYGGTYFPPEDRHGRHGFASVLRILSQGWANDRAKLVEESQRVIGALGDYLTGQRDGEENAPSPTTELVDAAGQAFEKCFQYLYESFDQQQGGFGGAPKFPRASNLDFLFRCAVLQGPTSEAGREAINMATTTLQRMVEGGIHDHVGGGFHRYAVDEAWFVPHFEKMLYDQAQIAVNLVDAYSFTGDQRFAWAARDVLDYVLRDLAHERGAFFAAEDADSETEDGGRRTEDTGRKTEGGGQRAKDGGPKADREPATESNVRASAAHRPPSSVLRPPTSEGAFYLWTREQLEQVLGEDAEWFCDHFGVTAEGNVPESLDPHAEMRGGNILKQQRPLIETAKRHGQDVIALADKLAAALDRLRAVRALRPRPHRDEKIITAWNGLMLSALARASTCGAGCLDDKRPFYAAAAERCATFVEAELYDAEAGILYRSWRDGRGSSEGFAEDYAAWISGLLDLYEANHDVRWLTWAERLQRSLDERFWDEEQGGYFQARAGDASIVLRIKDDHDGAEPSANSLAAANLARLGNLLHDRVLIERAERTLRAFQAQWLRVPQALPAMLCALEWVVQPARQLVLAGDPESAAMKALKAEAIARPGPRRTLVVLTGEPSEAWLVEPSPVLKAMTERMTEPCAYLCEGETCQAPVCTPADLRALLEG